ncbi:TniQ family protein [Bosea sp. UC22_33]|uniref:TniQ family protein n=1 Tax=Bosea sp. UC22_33 TaxID=3350165 RepID=UPI0036721F29
MMRFPLRRSAYTDEPAKALVFRRSQENGLTSAQVGWKAVGSSAGKIWAGGDLSLVAKACGVSLDNLAWVTPQRVGDRTRTFGQPFRHHEIQRRGRRWCAACLREAPYHRAAWDVSALRICVTHSQSLSETCPACKKATSWTYNDICRCSCGTRLSDTGNHFEQGSFDLWIGHRLQELSGSAPTSERSCTARFDDLFPGIELQDAIDVALRAGAVIAAPTAPPKMTIATQNRAALLNIGFEALTSGEAGFLAFLERLRDSRSTGGSGGEIDKNGPWGLAHAYGPFARWLASRHEEPAFTTAIRLARSHARRNVTLKHNSLVFAAKHDRTTPNLAEAANSCGIGTRRFRKLSVSVDLLPPKKLQGRPAPLSNRAVRLLGDRIRNSVTNAGAAKLLGIGRHAVTKLIDAGLLKTLDDARHGPRREQTIELCEIDKLIARIELNCGNEKPGETWAPLLSVAPRSYVSIATAIEWVLAGTIDVKLVPGVAIGLQRFCLDPSQVVRKKRDLGGDRITILDAADHLKIKWQAVKQLVELEYIEAEQSTTGWTIATESLRAFEARFVKGTEVAERLNMHWSWAPRYLASKGIQPAISRQKCRSIFYLRTEVSQHLPGTSSVSS